MEKGKHEKRKVQIFEKYSVLILIATLLMSIGYAEITGIDMQVATNVETTAQEGVFITDITRTEYSGADITASKINSYIDTTVNSTVVLGSEPSSYITYYVSVYNKTDREQVFIGPFGLTGEGLYDNSLITYELGGLVPYETILLPGKNYSFTIRFKYVGNDTSKNTLTSKINFRFMEKPELAVTNEGEITGIYPGYTPQEYEFTVSNYDGDKINNVALSYGLTAEIQKPFIAKIYDSTGAEVTSSTAIDVAGKNAETGAVSKVEHTYKLKIIWDGTNPESGVAYNNVDYAGQTYTAKINMVAKPKANSDGINKYENYQLTQAKDITVKTAPMHLKTEPNNTTIEMTNNRGEINLAVSNNNGSEYNPYETKYTISQDNTKYTLYVDETEYANNITGERTIGTGEKITLVEKIWLVPKTGVELTGEETANITISITSPYTNKTEMIQIKITDITPPTAPTITGGSESYLVSQTISVSEVATDVGTGVKNYEYLVNNTGEAIADASGNVGSTESETSKTFNTDYNGYYIWFRAVDKVGNKGEWSNVQQLNIDPNPPIVELVEEGTAKVGLGTNYDVSGYFTYDQNGSAGIEEVTYTINGEAISNINELDAVGTYTILCTVIKENGMFATESKIIEIEKTYNAVDVAAAPETFYGAEVVNYDGESNDASVNKWLIFHSDEEYIYLIADTYVHSQYIPPNFTSISEYYYFKFTDDILANYVGSADLVNSDKYSLIKKWLYYAEKYPDAQTTAAKVTAFLWDVENWRESFANSEFANYAVGAPTLDLLVASYNKKYPSAKLVMEDTGTELVFISEAEDFTETGLGGTADDPKLNVDDTLYWNPTGRYYFTIAGAYIYNENVVDCWPCYVNGVGNLRSSNPSSSTMFALRPVICLKSDVELTDLGGNQYAIKGGRDVGASIEIDLVPNTTLYTTEDVTVTVQIEGDVSNVTISCTGTSGTDYIINGTESVLVKTNDQTVTVTAQNTEGNTATASLTIDNIDRTAPTAPIITGGNTSTTYATELTIETSTLATDAESYIDYYEYYYTSSSAVPTANTEATGEIPIRGLGVCAKFTDNASGDYVYFRAVDALGHKGEWSNAERIYIDKNPPIVKVNNSSITIKEGERSDTFESLFTVEANGNNTNITRSYTLNGSDTTGITTLGSLTRGTHTLICYATKKGGVSGTGAMTIVVEGAKASVSVKTPENGDDYFYVGYQFEGLLTVSRYVQGNFAYCSDLFNITLWEDNLTVYYYIDGSYAVNDANNWLWLARKAVDMYSDDFAERGAGTYECFVRCEIVDGNGSTVTTERASFILDARDYPGWE